MMNRLLLIAAMFFCVLQVNAQENYDASLIPKELLPYASSIVRSDEEKIEVKDVYNSTLTVKKAVTVLNKNGDDNAHIVIYYDKEDFVKNIKGVVYNEFGKPIGKFSQSDFADQSVADGFSLFESARVKHYLPAVTEYPYTIAYEFEVRSKQTLNFDPWEPIANEGEAIEQSSFVFSCKPDFPIRFHEVNLNSKAIAGVNVEKEKTLTWQVNNLKAVRYEPYSPYYKKVIPSVSVVPERFSYYGIDGSFSDWDTLGKWIYSKLIAQRQVLLPETVDHIRDLTKDISDPKLKAKKIYEYMQNKTHYVSVQIGLGGFRPFLANDVDHQNYGDCKALVNYTQALLKAVNIDSWYCIVQAGRHYKVGLLDDFASMEQGNHIILCIPFKNDTTWADCTSQTIPFGYLGDFTDDRNVLACTPEGGKLLHTPKYTVNDDLESRQAEFVMSPEGAISGTMTTLFKGADYDSREELLNESLAEQNKILQKIYPVNNMVITKYELKQDKSFNPSTTETLKLQARDYASFTGGKYFFLLNPVNRVEETPRHVLHRQNDVYINRGYTDIDEVTYTVPAGYHLEKDPLNVSIDKPFAKFSATMELKGNQLTYKRKFQMIDGTYPKDTYQDVVDFFESVVDADGYTVSLVKD